jgi:hypothetical protein
MFPVSILDNCEIANSLNEHQRAHVPEVGKADKCRPGRKLSHPLVGGEEEQRQLQGATAGLFDKLRAGSSTALLTKCCEQLRPG